MKPREFDELVRQKFDQGEFAYNPRNWDQLAEQMDGRAKKRSILMWWLMPLAGVAASVALAMGVSPVTTHEAAPGAAREVVRTENTRGVKPAQQAATLAQEPVAEVAHTTANTTQTGSKHHNKPAAAVKEERETEFRISYQNAIKTTQQKKKVDVDLLAATTDNANKKKTDRKKDVAVNDAMNTFIPEGQQPKVPKLSIILTGGYSAGAQNSAYSGGASVRRMISNKVFIEGNIGLASATNTQDVPYRLPNSTPGTGTGGPNDNSSTTNTTKATKTTGGANQDIPQQTFHGFQTVTESYNVYYAQLHPSIGVKITKKLSIGAGPDFQQALADNRPGLGDNNNGNQAVAPLFDVGMTGTTEYSISRNLKAAVSYRKGINNLFSPGTDKYIDRNYLQFQVKCAVFNK